MLSIASCQVRRHVSTGSSARWDYAQRLSDSCGQFTSGGCVNILKHTYLRRAPLGLSLLDKHLRSARWILRNDFILERRSKPPDSVRRYRMPPCRALLQGLYLFVSLSLVRATGALDGCKISIVDLSDPSYGLPKCDVDERCPHTNQTPNLACHKA